MENNVSYPEEWISHAKHLPARMDQGRSDRRSLIVDDYTGADGSGGQPPVRVQPLPPAIPRGFPTSIREVPCEARPEPLVDQEELSRSACTANAAVCHGVCHGVCHAPETLHVVARGGPRALRVALGVATREAAELAAEAVFESGPSVVLLASMGECASRGGRVVDRGGRKNR